MNFTFSDEFKNILQYFIIGCRLNQPKDVIDYAVHYFKKLQTIRRNQNVVQIKQFNFPIDIDVSMRQMDTRDCKIFNYSEDEDSDTSARSTPKLEYRMSNKLISIFVNKLKESIVFCEMDVDQIKEIIIQSKKLIMLPGDVVYEINSLDDRFYMVECGEYSMYDENYELDGTLKSLDYFGELTLLHFYHRHLTIRCDQPGILWSIRRRQFRRRLNNLLRKNLKLFHECLLKIPIFGIFSNAELLDATNAMSIKRFKSEDNIFLEEDICHGLYFIVEGRVSLTIRLNCANKQTLIVLTEGQYFGEIALIGNVENMFSARAITNVKVIFLCVNLSQRMTISRDSIFERID